MSIYGGAIYANKSYYGYTTKTISYTYTAGTSVRIALSATETRADGESIIYSISTDAGLTYTEFDGEFSYVPETDSASQSFVFRIDFITQSIASSISVQDVTLTVSGDVTLYSLAVLILNAFDDETGILENKYTIDSALGAVSIPNAYLLAQSYQSALELICAAGAARAYSTRDGYLIIEQVGKDATSEISRDYDSYYAIQNVTNPESLYNRVSIQVNPLTKSSARVEVAKLSKKISANTVETYTLNFKVDPSEDIIYSGSTLPSGVTITDSTDYTWGSEIEVTNTNGTEQSIIILLEGYTYTVDGAYDIQLDDSASIRQHGVSELLIDNPLIQTEEQATAINELLIASFKNQKRIVETDISFNPALEIGDGANIDRKGYSVYSQNIEYSDGLNQIIKGIKI